MKLILTLILALITLPATLFAVPTLTVDGSLIAPLAGPSQDLTLTFGSSQQSWSVLWEMSLWRDVNHFGVYDGIGAGTGQTEVFTGTDSEGLTKTTNFTAGQEYGLYLLNDINNNGQFDGTDSYLFSERSLTAGSYANEHQWFQVYDVSAYGESDFFFNTSTEDFRHHGDYDYLIFIDDDHTSANWDHNDMILGVSSPVPEPATIILMGLGMAGLGVYRRRHSR